MLALTFANGIGMAMRWPVFAASVPDIVSREDMRPARVTSSAPEPAIDHP